MLFSGLDDAVVLHPVYVLLFARTGLSAGEISTLLALWCGSNLALEVPTGALADRVSRRGLLALGALSRAAGFALWVLFPSFPAFAAGFILWSVKSALTSGTLQALVYEGLAATGETARYTRLVGRGAAVQGGAGLVATAVAAPLLALGGYGLVGAASVFVCLCQVPVALSFPPAWPTRAGADGGVGSAGGAGGAGWRGYLGSLREGVGEVARRPVVRRVVVLAGLVPALAAFDEYVPLLAKDDGVPEPAIPLLLLVPGVAMVVAALLVGTRGARRIGLPLAAAGALVGIGAWVGTAAGVAAVGVGIGACHLARLCLDVRLQHAVEGNARATVTSVAGVLGEAGALVLVAAYGIGSRWLDLRWLFVLTAAALLLVATAVRRVSRGAGPPS